MTKNKHEKALQPNGTLERTLGNTAAIKIIDFLSTHNNYDYSKQDIARYSDVSMRHTLVTLEKLEKIGLVKNTRNVGHSHMYQINAKDGAMKTLEKFIHIITFKEAPDEDEPDPNLILEQRQEKGKELLVEIPV